MTAPTTTLSEDFWAKLAWIHGHRCPMSIMGARLGHAASLRVGRHGKGVDVTALFMNRNCALDGIMATLGTTPGNQNLKVDPRGLNMLEAANDETGARVRVTLTEEALSLGKRYAELRKSGGGEVEREEILQKLQSLPETEVVEVAVLPPETRCCR